MDFIQDFLSGNNFWLNLLFLILAVMSILVSIIIYHISIKKKKCVYNIATFDLIDNSLKSINDLEIKFKHQLIKNLSVSYVSIWNSGNDVINKDDFANLKPLTITINNANLRVNGVVKGGDTIKQGGYEKGETTINAFIRIVNYFEKFVKYISPNLKLLREILTIIFVLPILIIVIPILVVTLPLEVILGYFNHIPKEYRFENIYKTINND